MPAALGGTTNGPTMKPSDTPTYGITVTTAVTRARSSQLSYAAAAPLKAIEATFNQRIAPSPSVTSGGSSRRSVQATIAQAHATVGTRAPKRSTATDDGGSATSIPMFAVFASLAIFELLSRRRRASSSRWARRSST